jgi:hypothetical protein
MLALPLLRATTMIGAAVLSAATPSGHPVAGRPTPALVAAADARAPAVVGTYVIRSVNGHALPFADRVPSTPGYEHRVTLGRAALRLDPDGAFRLTAHYAHDHTSRGAATQPAPQKDDVVKGGWTLRGNALTLVPARSKRGRQPVPLVARLTAGRLVLPYDVRTGTAVRHYVFVGAYDPSYF